MSGAARAAFGGSTDALWPRVVGALTGVFATCLAATVCPAAERIEAIQAPAGTLRAIWFEHDVRCHKLFFKTSAIGPNVACDDDIVDAHMIESTTDGRIVFAKPWTVRGEPRHFLGRWSYESIDVIAYGAGWSGYFATLGGMFIEPWKPESGPPRFVPDNRFTFSFIARADRRAWGVEIAAEGLGPLYHLSSTLRRNLQPFLADLAYLLAERLCDPGISTESRLRLENHLARLGDIVRFWQLDGPSAHPVSSQIAGLANDIGDERPWVRWPAAVALGSTGVAAVEPLRAALRSTDRQTRIAAAMALRRIGPVAHDAAPDFAARLGDPDRESRRAAVAALAAVFSGENASDLATTIVAAATPLLGDGDADIAISATDVLGRCGPAARGALPVLKQRVTSGDADARLAALRAVGHIDPQDSELIAADITALSVTDDRVREQAIGTVVAFGAGAVPQLTPILTGPDPGAAAAAQALGRIGPEAAAAVPALIQALDDRRFYLRRDAARALGRIGPSAHAAVPALVALLQDTTKSEREEDRKALISALGGIGPGAAAAVPVLIELVRSGGESGMAAAVALGDIGPAAEPAIPQLGRALTSWPENYRDTLPVVLGKIGSEHAVPALVDALRQSSMSMTCKALGAFTLIGPKAVPPLETALHALPEPGSAEDANARFKIQSAIASLRADAPGPVECRGIFTEMGLR